MLRKLLPLPPGRALFFRALSTKNTTQNALDNQIGTPEASQEAVSSCVEDISDVAPYLKPTYNFAAYINRSETLQELLKIGVDLHKLELKKGVPEYILRLNFASDVKDYVEFLHGLGLSVPDVGEFITKCPLIFKEDLADLQVRVNYLHSKKFTDEMVLRIVSTNPAWLTFSTQNVDDRLGYFQKEYQLTGDQVRVVTIKKPALITSQLHKVKLNTFVMKEEMGFDNDEVREILLKSPALFLRGQSKLLKAFEYLHKTMGISHKMILQQPDVLTCRLFRLRERHLFLERLNKLQFDPKKPNYISPGALVAGTDAQFSTEVAKSSVQAYNLFLKSL